MEDFVKFRKFITPVIIQILFWVGIAVVIVVGLVGIASGISRGNAGAIFSALLTLVLGPVLVRVYCELLIVAFRILDVLVDIRGNTQRSDRTD